MQIAITICVTFSSSALSKGGTRCKGSICVLSDKSHLTFDKIPMEFIDQHKINSLSSFAVVVWRRKDNFFPYPYPRSFCLAPVYF